LRPLVEPLNATWICPYQPPERRLIVTPREAWISLREIARRTGRHYSSISRELCRNAHRSDEIDLIGYYPVTAQDRAGRHSGRTFR